MAFHFKLIFCLACLTIISSCKEELPDHVPEVNRALPLTPFYISELNVLRSDFLNWDSIKFRYNRQLRASYDRYNTVIEFISEQQYPDTLTLTFDRLNFKVNNPYLCGSPQTLASINKFGKRKYLSEGNEKSAFIYHQFSKDSAEISFNIKQNSYYRLPDNTILNGRIMGRFRLPRLK